MFAVTPRPTQLLIHWVLLLHERDKIGHLVKLITHLHFVLRCRYLELHLHVIMVDNNNYLFCITLSLLWLGLRVAFVMMTLFFTERAPWERQEEASNRLQKEAMLSFIITTN